MIISSIVTVTVTCGSSCIMSLGKDFFHGAPDDVVKELATLRAANFVIIAVSSSRVSSSKQSRYSIC